MKTKLFGLWIFETCHTSRVKWIKSMFESGLGGPEAGICVERIPTQHSKPASLAQPAQPASLAQPTSPARPARQASQPSPASPARPPAHQPSRPASRTTSADFETPEMTATCTYSLAEKGSRKAVPPKRNITTITTTTIT